MSAPVQVHEFVNSRPLVGYLLRVPILCVLLMLVEGIDAFGIGFVGPFLARQLALTPERLGTIYTGTVIASLVGGTIIAPLSDRFGRRPMLLWMTGVMIPATIGTALAPNFEILFVMRFVIGAAFGAALPLAIALVADYAPLARRSLLLMLLNAGIGAGVVIAGYAAAAIIPALGWQALLFFSAGLSALLTLVAWRLLPESLQHLVRTGRQQDALAIADRIAPGAAPAALIWLPPEDARESTPLALFRGGALATTVLLWALISFSYVTINFNSYWLPTVLMNAGASVSTAGLAVSTGKLCGIAGILLIGWISDRYGLAKVATANFLLTGVFVLAIAGAPSGAVGIALLIAALSLDGANVSGGQALTATSYPSHLRGTAMGWVSGFARLIGGGGGAMIGAHVVASGWSVAAITALMSGTFFINALLVQILTRHRLRTTRADLGREPGATIAARKAEPLDRLSSDGAMRPA